MATSTLLSVVAASITPADSLAGEARLLFADDFSAESRGLRERNALSDPPPDGSESPGHPPDGYALKNWLIADAAPTGEDCSSWYIPVTTEGTPAEFMEQSGHPQDSIAYARLIIPQSLNQFTVEFRQWATDNNYIGFVLGAKQPLIDHSGFEFGYLSQRPGTVETTIDAYITGDLGETCAKGMALRGRWVSHRIEVAGQEVRWFQDDKLSLVGKTSKRLSGGYFGIRHRQARGTRYDDVRITTTDPAVLDRPNVLFIVVDDLRCDLGCYGANQVQSPHMDKLAAQGILFSHAYCQYPLCNPSRASVLTGLRPDATGMNRDEIQNRYHFREKIPQVETLPQLFQRYGYRVGRIGKLYHYGVPREIGTESLLDDRASWQFAIYPRGGEKDEEDQLISYTPDRSPGWALSWQKSRTPASLHTDALVADAAIKKMQELQAEPFFLAVGFFRPHVPSTAPPEFFDPYPLEAIQLPTHTPEQRSLLPDAAIRPIMRVNVPRTDLAKFKRAYYATITLVDQQIGRLVDSLDSLGLAENTIVVLWSDHGFLLGEHEQWTKPFLFENCVRCPFIIRAPGQRSNGIASQRIVELLDIYPTLAELCSLSAPTDLAGKSLVPVLEDPSSEWEDVAFSQVGSRHSLGYSVRTAEWRYTEWDQGESGRELYNYQTDPEEQENLAHNAEYADLMKRLSKLLAQQRE